MPLEEIIILVIPHIYIYIVCFQNTSLICLFDHALNTIKIIFFIHLYRGWVEVCKCN